MMHIDSQRYLLMLLLSGVIAIIFGILVIVWQLITLFALVIIFGAYALVDGLVAMLTGLQNLMVTSRRSRPAFSLPFERGANRAWYMNRSRSEMRPM